VGLEDAAATNRLALAIARSMQDRTVVELA
jgi:hypothetical protein